MNAEFFNRIPKTDLHNHYDGGMRIETLIDLAKQENITLPAYDVEGLKKLVFRDDYKNLVEYLECFGYTNAVLTSLSNMERLAYELGVDCFSEHVHFTEIRLAPQLTCNKTISQRDVLRVVDRGLKRARDEFNAKALANNEPPYEYGIIVCALRAIFPNMSEYYNDLTALLPHSPASDIVAYASMEAVRSAVESRDLDGTQVVAFDIAGAENGFPASVHAASFKFATANFLKKTLHAGEAYGAQSIYSAIKHCNADRIGHGTHLFDTTQTLSQSFIDRLVDYVAQQQIGVEVCLTSNQDTIPELKDDLTTHTFRKMLEHNVRVTINTDNRTVSKTTSSKEFAKAVETFKLTPQELKQVVMNGFHASFFPGTYNEKLAFIKKQEAYYDSLVLA